MSKHYDYIAIGGGSGGIASINRAAMYGQKCALIEAKELGGTCVNVGCVPKKVMWHAAQIREAIHMYGPDYGFDTTINHFDWDKLIASRTAYIDRIHTSYDNVLGKNNVDVIRGFARFVDEDDRSEWRDDHRRSHPDRHRRPSEPPEHSGRGIRYRLRRFLRAACSAGTRCHCGRRLHRG